MFLLASALALYQCSYRNSFELYMTITVIRFQFKGHNLCKLIQECIPVGCFTIQGRSLSRGGLCPGWSLSSGSLFRGLCPRGSLSGGVSVQGVSVQGYLSRGISVWGSLSGGSLSRGSLFGGLCLGVSVKGVSVQGSLSSGVSVQGVSVQGSLSRGSLSRRFLSRGSLSGVSVQGGLHPRISVQGGLCLGVSVQGVSVWGLCQGDLCLGVCHGMTELVKVHRKDQSVEDFTSKCLFLLFWPILCISLISLIEIWSFCTNLLENYPSRKIDQLPPLRILSLCKDQLFLLDCCMDQQFVPISFVSIHALALFWPEWCKDPCLSLSIVYSCLESSIGAQVFPILGSIPQYMDHLLISLLLTWRYFP